MYLRYTHLFKSLKNVQMDCSKELSLSLDMGFLKTPQFNFFKHFFLLKLSKKSHEFKNILVIDIAPQIAVKKTCGILRVKSHGFNPYVIIKNTQFSLFQKYVFLKIKQKII